MGQIEDLQSRIDNLKPTRRTSMGPWPIQRAISFHADKCVLAQSGRGVVFLQGQSLSGTSFTSLKQLQDHIDAYVNAYNDRAKPFVWTKKRCANAGLKAAVSLSSVSGY